MITDYVIAIDVSEIYVSLGGEKPDHRPEDKKLLLEQSRHIIEHGSSAFRFIVFLAEFTNEHEFLCVKKEIFKVHINSTGQCILTPSTLDNIRLFKTVAAKYGAAVNDEVSCYIDNAKEYYRSNAGGYGKLSSGVRVIQAKESSHTLENTNKPVITPLLKLAPSPQG